MSRAVTALTIAGSDPSGGAGIQADLKTFSALGVYGTAVLTALTAQNTRGVTAVQVVGPAFVEQQLETLVEDVQVDAMKVGMLADEATAGAVGAFLAAQRCPVVVLDPVMVATSGDRLLDDGAVEAVRRLIPSASVITPNLPEAAVLLDEPPASSLAALRGQAGRLLDLGARRVLLKGGHLPDSREAVDVYRDAEEEILLRSAWIDTRNTHGTGCTLSSALAALRPQREDWPSTVQDAKRWLTEAIRRGAELRIGHGHGPVHHFHALWD